MSEAKFTNLDTINVLVYEKALSYLTPIPSIGSINSSLICDVEANTLNLIILDLTSVVKIDIPCNITISEIEEPKFGIQIDFKKFLYSINQYKDNNNTEISMVFDKQAINFIIKNGTDKISLPAIYLPLNKINEYNTILSPTFNENSTYEFKTSDEKAKAYLIDLNQAIKNSHTFIGKDENKNNAGSIYIDKFIVNDGRHVYQQKLNSVSFYEDYDDDYISLHKKNMKIFSDTLNTDNNYTLTLTKDNTKMLIDTTGFKGVFNNALANAVPPETQDLVNIRPETKVYESTVDLLQKAVLFFNGFYTSSNELRPLSLRIKSDNNSELLMYIKDTGIAGFGEYSIEKILPTNTDLTLKGEDIVATVIYDSMKDFLNKQTPDEIVSIYMDEHPAVYVKTTNSEIYLAKLQG